MRDVCEGPLLQRLWNWVQGDKVFLWVTEHHPRAGYYLDLVDSPTPEDLWHRHSQRVAAIAKSRETSIPPQNSIRLYLAICERISEINRYRQKIQEIGQWTTGILLVFSIVLFFLLQESLGQLIDHLAGAKRMWLAAGTILGILVCFLLLPLVGQAWPKRIGPWVGRQLPWPRVRTLDELLQ